MHPRNTLIAALALGILAACNGGPENAQQGKPGTEGSRGGDATSSATTAPGLVSIGVQPVENTPVDSLPTHPNHTPLTESPAEPAPLVEPAPTYANQLYVASSGNDAAAGDQGAPFRTIGKAISVAKPGTLIHVASGTYAEKLVLATPGATSTTKITIQGEGKPKLVPGAGTGAVVQFKAPGWVLDGFDIDVQSQPTYAVTFQGNTDGAVLANNEIHGGSLGGGITTYDSARGMTIENNHIHDFTRGNDDSHGIVIQPTTKKITIRNNDIHDNSGDSVQCLGPEGFSSLPPADGVVIENNHLYSNRENAVDIKTCANVIVRNNRMHGFRMASSAKGDAVVIHMSAKNVTVEGNDISDCGKGISIGGNHTGPVPTNIRIEKNRIHDLTTETGMEGTGIRVENSSGAKLLNNTITRTPGYGMVIGFGTGGATSNLEVANNIVDNPKSLSLGTMRPGLKLSQNLFTGTIAQGQAATTIESLRTAGVDHGSLTGNAGLQGDDFAPGAIAVDAGADVGLPFCGKAPDLGALETGC